MKQVICRLLFFLLAVSSPGILLAQPNTLYFLNGIPQTKDMNPARPGIVRGFYLSMPLLSRLDLSANTNNWSYNDLIHRGTGSMSDSLVWDFGRFHDALGKNNFLNESAALTLLEFGWKKGAGFLGFSWSEREFAEVSFSRNLADILFYGNAPYLGSTQQTGYVGVSAQHYRELALTYARDLNKKMSFGVTGKMLIGFAGLKTPGLNVVAGMPQSGDRIDLQASGKAYLSAPVDIQVVNSNGYKVSAKDLFDTNQYLTNTSNSGMAVDLGFVQRVNNNFEYSVSLIDLGYINWRSNTTIFTESGRFLFRGINLDTPTATHNPTGTTDVRSLLLSLRDSMRVIFLPTESNNSFTTMLPVKFYLAGQFKVSDRFSYGALARIRLYNNLLHTSLTASANTWIAENVTLSASYSIMESTFDNIGVGASWRFGNVQLYSATDNLFSLFNPPRARNMNFRFGVNLIFRDHTYQWNGGTRRN